MICGEFTFNSTNLKYCKKHIGSHPEIEFDDEYNFDKTKMRTFKVRVFFSKEQIVKLTKFFGDYRYTYNKLVEDNVTGDNKQLKKQYVTDINKNFLAETPTDIRSEAVREYNKNKSNIEKQYIASLKKEEYLRQTYKNYKHKNIKVPIMTYKSKKSEQCIQITKNAITMKNDGIIIFPESFSDKIIKFNKRAVKKDKKLQKILNKQLFHSVKIIRTLDNKYYICFIEDILPTCDNKPVNAVAIDTGGRTFVTVLSESGTEEYGHDMNEKIGEMINERKVLRKKYEEMIKLLKYNKDNLKIKKKCLEAKQKYRKICVKIENRIMDMHYKVIAKLTDAYTNILIPKLNVAKIMKDQTLPVRARQILEIESHGLFIKRLQSVAEKKGVNVKIVSEHQTSMTCGHCFSQKKTKDKTYVCEKCKMVIDRDINGARNIYILELCKMVLYTAKMLKELC